MGAMTISAAVDRGVGVPASVEPLRIAAPGPGQVRIRIDACAVCHSDLSFVDGDWAADRPVVWGHEAAGTVLDLGPPPEGDAEGAAPPEEGDRVMVSLLRSCGRCRACRRDRAVLCEQADRRVGPSPLTDADGRPVHRGLRTGAFAEAVVVDRSQVLRLPDEVPAAEGALLGCGVLTGVGAVRHDAGVGAGDRVVVIGAGGVGLHAIQAATILGAEQVVAVDPSPDRRALATRLGATTTVDPATDETDALGGSADHVIVATGAEAALAGAPSLLAPGGTMVLVGMAPDGARLTIDPTALAAAGQRIVGSKMGSARFAADVAWLLDRRREGRLALTEVIGDAVPLAQIDHAFDKLRRRAGVRHLVVP